MKVILVKDCIECPLVEIDDEGVMFCGNGVSCPLRKIGELEEYIKKKVIPGWCPLSDLDDVCEKLRGMG